MSDDKKTEEDEPRATADQVLALRARLRIDPLALQDEFLRIAVDISYFAGLHGVAVENELRAESRAKKLRALYEMEAREALADDLDRAQARENKLAENEKRKPDNVRGRGVTEGMIKAWVDSKPEWFDVEMDVADSARRAIEAKGNMSAVMAKRDALIQLGATERAEMERDPSIREKARSVRG